MPCVMLGEKAADGWPMVGAITASVPASAVAGTRCFSGIIENTDVNTPGISMPPQKP